MTTFQLDNNDNDTTTIPMPEVEPIDVYDLSRRFVPGVGWMPLFRNVAELGHGNWIKAESKLSPYVVRMRNDLERAVNAPDSLKSKWATQYRMALDRAKNEFIGLVKEAFKHRDANDARRAQAETEYDEFVERQEEELGQLEARKDAAQAALDRELIGLGGDKGAQIHTPAPLNANQKALKWGGIAAILIMTLVVEVIIGRGAIESQTSRQNSQIAVAALALFSLFVIHFTVDDFRGFLVNLGARYRFKKNGDAPEGVSVYPFPMSRAFMAVAGVLFIFMVSVTLLGYRVWVAVHNQTGLAAGQAGDLVAPFVLISIIYASFFVFYRLSPDYTERQYKQLDELRGKFEQAEHAYHEKKEYVNQLRQPQQFEPVDTFEAEIDSAKNYYMEFMDVAGKNIEGEVMDLEQQRTAIILFLESYDTLYNLHDDAVRKGMNALMEEVRKVEQAKPANQRAELPKLNDQERTEARQMFRGITARRFDSDEFKQFLNVLKVHTFVAEYPVNERVGDFESLVEQVERELNPPEPEPVADEQLRADVL